MRRWNDWGYFPPSRPLAAKGGIRAQSARGGFGESWWAKRWIGVLEAFELGARLQRGRSYARRGQVLSICIEKGIVTARVQGSRPKPYEVKIRVKPIPASGWNRLAQAVSRQAIFAAKLLAGEMPQEIGHLFASLGLSLFPERLDGLHTECSCPDWSNPCKHIAAVYYLLGEEFDRDPFLIFRLRGISREEFLGLLGKTEIERPDATSSRQAPPPEPLPADPALFWAAGSIPDNWVGERLQNSLPAALPRRLGNFPFWGGSERFLDVLEAIYRAAQAKARETLEAEWSRESENEDETHRQRRNRFNPARGFGAPRTR